MLKKIVICCIWMNVCLIGMAQQAEQKENGATKQFPLPGGQVSAPVQLPKEEKSSFVKALNNIGQNLRQGFNVALETFMPFQFKYALMLNEKVEKLTNVALYKTIDDWYGTRYRYGGTTERGIDCSAFMQVLGNYAFGWSLPRTAREQYQTSVPISKDDLREGDLVFFNTTGGVSHVGMYLQNGKFIHSSSSNGVVISDLSEAYWKARFIGARRKIDNMGEETQPAKDGLF